MKKFLPIILVGIMVLGGVGAVAGHNFDNETMRSEMVSFSHPDIIEKQDYCVIQLEESTFNSISENKPLIPMVSKVYTFPFGTIIRDVDVSFSEPLEESIDMLVEVSPEVEIFSTMYQMKNKVSSNQVVDYSDIEIYPDSKFEYRAAAGLKNDEHVIYLTVTLSPIQYKPNENLILYSEEAKVDITYTLPKKPFVFPDEYDMLILTPSQFESALQRLVDFKNNLNPPIRTVMVTLDEIPSGVGVDTQEDIKYYIKDALEMWGFKHLLLVGAGIEGSELFPVRKAYHASTPHEDYFPSDLYYADIYNSTGEFSDWDVDEDGLFAEYPRDKNDIDILPDVYLGKIPCNDVNELNIVIDKIIDYKEHNKMVSKILQVGGDSAPGSGIYEGEYANEKVLETLPGYTSIKCWATEDKCTKDCIGSGFRSIVDFVDISGHGSYMSWATHPPDDDSQWIPPKTLFAPWTGFLYLDIDIYRLTNSKKYPVVVFTACSNNKYTMSENCIGWNLLSKNNGGSIATFAESGIGYGPTGPNFVNSGIGLMEVNIFKEIVETKVLGEAWNNCMVIYYSKFDPNFKREDYQTMLEFLMFGDPSVAIEDGDDPRTHDVNNYNTNNLVNRLIEQFPLLYRIFETMIARFN